MQELQALRTFHFELREVAKLGVPRVAAADTDRDEETHLGRDARRRVHHEHAHGEDRDRAAGEPGADAGRARVPQAQRHHLSERARE